MADEEKRDPIRERLGDWSGKTAGVGGPIASNLLKILRDNQESGSTESEQSSEEGEDVANKP
jgi:hypothetical protein